MSDAFMQFAASAMTFGANNFERIFAAFGNKKTN